MSLLECGFCGAANDSTATICKLCESSLLALPPVEPLDPTQPLAQWSEGRRTIALREWGEPRVEDIPEGPALEAVAAPDRDTPAEPFFQRLLSGRHLWVVAALATAAAAGAIFFFSRSGGSGEAGGPEFPALATETAPNESAPGVPEASPTPTPTTPSQGQAAPAPQIADPTARAESYLLTLADMPSGFVETSGEDDEEDDSDNANTDSMGAECRGMATGSVGALAEADRGFTTNREEEDISNISNGVVVYDSAESLAQAYDEMIAGFDCMAAHTDPGDMLSDLEGVSVDGLTISRLSFAQMGERSEAYRMQMRMTVSNGGESIELDVFLDFYFIQAGDALVALCATNPLIPIPTVAIEQFAAVVLQKIHGGTPPATA